MLVQTRRKKSCLKFTARVGGHPIVTEWRGQLHRRAGGDESPGWRRWWTLAFLHQQLLKWNSSLSQTNTTWGQQKSWEAATSQLRAAWQITSPTQAWGFFKSPDRGPSFYHLKSQLYSIWEQSSPQLCPGVCLCVYAHTYVCMSIISLWVTEHAHTYICVCACVHMCTYTYIWKWKC